MLLRALRTILRWTTALLTAWHRDSRVRTGEAARSWDALDRAQRWLSVAFYALTLWVVASNGFPVPDFGQGEDASWWIAVGLTAMLSGFVVISLARRVVVSNRNVAWRVADMPRDLRLALFPSAPRRASTEVGTDADVHVREPLFARAERGTRRLIGFPLVLAWLASVPVAIVLPHFVPSTAAIIAPFAGMIVVGTAVLLAVVAGAAQSVGIASDAIAKVRMLSPVRAAFGGTESEYERSRFRLRGSTLTVRNAPASVFADLDVANAKLASVSPEWMVDRHHTDAAQRVLVLTARVTGDAREDALVSSLANYLRVAPHEIVLRAHFDDDTTASPRAVTVTRYPRTDTDARKRQDQWRAMLTAETRLEPNEMWLVDEQEGVLTAYRQLDPLAASIDYPWDTEVPTHEHVPFAIREDGTPLALKLYESNILLGGLPGGGKSGGATCLLAGVGRLEHTALVGLDPKRVELAPWVPRFSMIAKDDDHATAVLDALVDEMDRRYLWIESQRGLKKISPAQLSAERPLIVLMIDELADLVSVGATKEEKTAEDIRKVRIRRLVAKGRAAGIVVITATQKPQADVIPSALRDLLQQRVAYATTNSDMTDTILGKGMSALGGAAHTIPQSLKGVCYMLSDSSREPIRARTYWIPDDQVDEIAERVAHLRVDLPWLPGEAESPPTSLDEYELPDVWETFDETKVAVGESFDFELPETTDDTDDPFAFLARK